MTPEPGNRANEHGLFTRITEAISLHTVVLVAMGLTAGYSLRALGTDVVFLPVIGPVPGLLVGGVGLAAVAIAYWKVGCCGSNTLGNAGGCGCSGECGDRCSIDR